MDAMTKAQRHAAAAADPDAQPIREEDLPRMPRMPQICVIRRALKPSQEELATAYRIPIGTRTRDSTQLRHARRPLGSSASVVRSQGEGIPQGKALLPL
jgi:hypothetical protein